MSDQQVQTAEFSRNPEPKVRFTCTVCKKEYDLKELLHEEPMPSPYQTMVEGFLLCPACGFRTHSYYMSEYLRFKQTQLKRAINRWQDTKKMSAWQEYTRLQKSFQAAFDKAQQRYTALFQEKPK